MPSRAIGMGMCPRCGRPGTVVIKAGNYVYIKHGNTWHYIGTIDKVNLNKILIKTDEITAYRIIYRTNNKIFTNKNKLFLGILVSIVSLLMFTAIILILHVNTSNNGYSSIKISSNNISIIGVNNSHEILNCIHVTLTNNSNNILITCNYSNIMYVNSFKVNDITNNQSSILYYTYVNLTNNK